MTYKVAEHHIYALGCARRHSYLGVGATNGRWDDVGFGYGRTEAEAYQEALDSLVQSDWDVTGLPSAREAGLDDKAVAPKGKDCYVAVYVRGQRCCGCNEMATTRDDTGIPVCARCGARRTEVTYV